MIKSIIKAGLTSYPIYQRLHTSIALKRLTTILCYHTLTNDSNGIDAWTALRVSDFMDQLEEVRKNYTILPLSDAFTCTHQLPHAVLTFDDGDVGLYRYLLPLLKKEKFPVTIYIATAQIENGTAFWFDRLMNACSRAERIEFEFQHIGHWVLEGKGKQRWLEQAKLHQRLKELAPELRIDIVNQIEESIDTSSKLEKLGPMSVKQLQELASLPNVTIGAHSHCHNLLDQISIDEARDSLLKNKELLEKWTDGPVKHFAYPNGNYNTELQKLVASLGFETAAALEVRSSSRNINHYALPRIPVGRYDDIRSFRLKLIGL